VHAFVVAIGKSDNLSSLQTTAKGKMEKFAPHLEFDGEKTFSFRREASPGWPPE